MSKAKTNNEPINTKKELLEAEKSTTPFGFVKSFLERYLKAEELDFWLLGTLCLLIIFLISSNYFPDQVTLPFIIKNSQGELSTSLSASPSGILKDYINLLGGFTLNDISKGLLLVFVIWLLLRLFINFLNATLIYLKNQFFNFSPSTVKKFLKINPRINSYQLKQWRISPTPLRDINAQGELIYPQVRKRIPFEIKEFKYIRFTISIAGQSDHWRAGVFITSESTKQDYVFHIYKNLNDPQLRTKMTKRIFAKGHINDSDKNLFVEDKNNFIFELVGMGSNKYKLKINNQDIDQYTVPKNNFKFIEVAAWADDRPYDIEFKNIEFLG